MEKLIELLQIEWTKDNSHFYEKLDKQTSIQETLNNHWFDALIPYSSQSKIWPDLDTLKRYLRQRFEKVAKKERDEALAEIERIGKAPTPTRITITVEWRKSRTWGSNPRAEVAVEYSDGDFRRYKSASIGGCGYDKESTAIAEALNQSDGILKLLYQAKNDGYNEENDTNKRVLGYGSGYGILPSFEGGVGTSCFVRIFDRLGYNWEKIASGEAFDIRRIIKKEESQK